MTSKFKFDFIRPAYFRGVLPNLFNFITFLCDHLFYFKKEFKTIFFYFFAF